MKDTELPEQVVQTDLDFSADKGSSRSTYIAVILLLLIVGWMGSGFVLPAEDVAEDTNGAPEPGAVTVAVAKSSAENITQFFLAEGQALPDRSSPILAEISGDIAEVLVKKGDMVEAGQVIARFDTTQREADLDRATEDLTRAERDFNNARTLLERGSATADRVSRDRAALAAARADFSAAKEAMKAAELRAPFGGRLETLTIDPGEYIPGGSEIARVVDNTPLTVSIQVPQQSLNRITAGQLAQVEFITGDVAPGIVTFVGTSAASDTRTFLAEIQVENADGAIPAGISAQVRIPTGETKAHFLSPAILSLSTEGQLGVKTTDADNKVVFSPVEIVRAQTDGIWVSGLPDEVDVITVGQGYVSNGETVAPQPEEALK